MSCTLAPKYNTPQSPITFEEGDVNHLPSVRAEEFFMSEEMQSIIQVALQNNRDLQLAILNIEKSRIRYNIARSNLMPSVNAETYYLKASDETEYSIGFAASYEIDFFGKIQSLNNASLAEFLAEKENKKIIEILIIAQTASLYLEAIKNKQNLLLAEQILQLSIQHFEIVNAKYNKGYIAKQDLIDAQFEFENNKILYEESKKNFTESKNNLSLLVGSEVSEENLQTSFRDLLFAQNLLNEVPSTNLLARPDIKKAEQLLIASNANIGAARAAFFPSVSLTGFTGYVSDDLKNLFQTGFWEFSPKVTLPIFTGGANKANLNLAHLKKQENIIIYEKAIENAFYESLNAINTKSANKLASDFALNIKEAKFEKYNIYKAKHLKGMETRERELQANIEYLQSVQHSHIKLSEYYISLVNVYKVFGGGSEIN